MESLHFFANFIFVGYSLLVLLVFLSLVECMVQVLLVWGGTLLKDGLLTVNLLGNIVSEVLVVSVKWVQRVFPVFPF